MCTTENVHAPVLLTQDVTVLGWIFKDAFAECPLWLLGFALFAALYEQRRLGYSQFWLTE